MSDNTVYQTLENRFRTIYEDVVDRNDLYHEQSFLFNILNQYSRRGVERKSFQQTPHLCEVWDDPFTLPSLSTDTLNHTTEYPNLDPKTISLVRARQKDFLAFSVDITPEMQALQSPNYIPSMIRDIKVKMRQDKDKFLIESCFAEYETVDRFNSTKTKKVKADVLTSDNLNTSTITTDIKKLSVALLREIENYALRSNYNLAGNVITLITTNEMCDTIFKDEEIKSLSGLANPPFRTVSNVIDSSGKIVSLPEEMNCKNFELNGLPVRVVGLSADIADAIIDTTKLRNIVLFGSAIGFYNYSNPNMPDGYKYDSNARPGRPVQTAKATFYDNLGVYFGRPYAIKILETGKPDKVSL